MPGQDMLAAISRPRAGASGDREPANASLVGYKENWAMLFGRLGVGCDASMTPNLKAFGEVGWKIPIVAGEIVDPSGLDVALSPKQRVSPFGEAGLTYRCFFVSVFYDSLRFDKSDIEHIAVIGRHAAGMADVWQPESKSDAFGANAGLVFRL